MSVPPARKGTAGGQAVFGNAHMHSHSRTGGAEIAGIVIWNIEIP